MSMLFDGWSGPLRIVVVGVPAYLILIALLRVTGKRALAKMNAFDFVITVALGSTLASVLLTKDVVLVEGIVAFLLLLGLQYGIAWLTSHVGRLDHFINGNPTLVVYRGRFLEAEMKRQRVTRQEVLAAMRARGVAGVETVGAVVLETDGSFSILAQADEGPGSTLQDVGGRPAQQG